MRLGSIDDEAPLKLDQRDRGRLVLVLAVTLLAVPTVWLITRDDDPAPAVAAPVATDGDEFDPLGEATDLYLTPIVLEGSGAPTTPEVVVGRADDQRIATALATYTRSSEIAGWDECAFAGVESGTDVTVVNVANGKSTTCETVFTERTDGRLVMYIDGFQQIAALTDAPVHVEIRR